jgi:hypothetical protein
MVDKKTAALLDGWDELFAGGAFGSRYNEDVVELGKRQHLFGVVGRVDENHLATATTKLSEEGNQNANAGTINVTDFGEVDGAVGYSFAEVLVDRSNELLGVRAAN